MLRMMILFIETCVKRERDEIYSFSDFGWGLEWRAGWWRDGARWVEAPRIGSD